MMAPSLTVQAATDELNTELIQYLLNRQGYLQNQIDVLNNAQATLADLQTQLTAVQQQLQTLGYVAPAPVQPAPVGG